MGKVLTFILFLVCYALYFVGAALFQKKAQKDLLEGKWFWSSQLGVLLGIGPFFLFVYLLSGFWSLTLVILFIVGAELGVIANAIFRAVGAPTDKSGPRVMWAAWEFGRTHKGMMILLMAPAIAVLIYPVMAGIAHFSHALSSRQLTITIFKYSLLVFVLGGYAFVVAPQVGTLGSENVDQQTRKSYLASQLSGLITTTLFLALASWAFGFAHSRVGTAVGGIPLAISPKLLLLLAIFYVLTTVLPYTIGTVRARNRNFNLSDKKRGFLRSLRDVLYGPIGTLYYSRLDQLRTDLNKEIEQFTERDAGLRAIAQDEISEEPVITAFRASRDLDPRFRYLDELRRYVTEVQEIVQDSNAQVNQPDRKDIARAWAARCRFREAELDKEIRKIEAAKHARTGATVAMGFLLTSIGAGILGEAGKWAWAIVSKSLPK